MRCGKYLGYSAEFLFLAAQARDVGLKMANGFSLRLHHPVHQVANGDYSDNVLAFEHGKVADAILGNNAHAVSDRVPWSHEDHRAAHDLANFRIFRIPALDD